MAPKGLKASVLQGVKRIPALQQIWHSHLRRAERRGLFNLYRRFLRPGDLCFDIGANVGDVSAVMLELGARVVALEPQDENIQVLKERFSQEKNFTVIPKAVGAQVGVGHLNLCDHSDCSSMSLDFVASVTKSGRLPGDIFKWTEVRAVEITTLDELIGQYGIPQFAKIDVEGFEADVIAGCSQKLRVLSLEFTPECLGPTMAGIQMLQQFGSVLFNYTVGRKRCFELESWTTGDEITRELNNLVHRPVTIGPGGDLYACYS